MERAQPLVGRPFSLPVVVYGYDVDHHCEVTPAAYLRFMDRGRFEAIETICLSLGLESWLNKYIINVYKISARFLAPGHMGENLAVVSSLHKTSSHRAAFLQQVRNQRGEVLAEAIVELLFLDNEHKLVPVPDELPASREPLPHYEPMLVPVPFGQSEHYSFKLPVRVYYENTDAQGITYHVAYFNFCERAFSESLKKVIGSDELAAWLSAWPLKIKRQINRYMNASHIGDKLDVLVGYRRLDEHTFILDQRIVDQNNTVCTDMLTEMQFVKNGILLPIPDVLIPLCKVKE